MTTGVQKSTTEKLTFLGSYTAELEQQLHPLLMPTFSK